MKDTLYIIGNGFDMHHGLDTNYKSFCLFLKENHFAIYDALICCIPILNPDDRHDRDHPWSELEDNLSELNFEDLIDNTDHGSECGDPKDQRSFQLDMEILVEKITKDLCEACREWILKVKLPNDFGDKMLSLKSNAIYLSFNYTDTIEEYYNIDPGEVLHIHGKAENTNDRIILGHGINPEDFKEKEEAPPEGLNEEDMEKWREDMCGDFFYELGKNELMHYFEKSHKSTDEIILQYQYFFDNLKNIKQIIVLGHSLSKVDQPYFSKIIQSLTDKTITWTVSYHDNKEKKELQEKLLLLGLSEKQIRLIKMIDLQKTKSAKAGRVLQTRP